MQAECNQKNPVLKKYVEESKKLYLIFGGISAGLGMVPFEFYKTARIVDENKFFFRDFSQSWYQNGLPGVGRNVFEVAGYIRETIDGLQPEEIYFVGNSMGGFAALLFASLVGKGKAIAFAPQSFISPILRYKHLDHRWQKQIIQTYIKTFYKKHVWDLKKWLATSTNDLNADIFVSKRHRLDYLHANRLRSTKAINIHEYDVGGHALVKCLRDEGHLPDILLGRYTPPSHDNGTSLRTKTV